MTFSYLFAPKQWRDRRLRPQGLAWCILALAVSCGTQESDPVVAPVIREEDSVRSEATSQLDALRALGYAGVSEESYGDDESGVVLIDEARVSPGYNLYSIGQRCQAVLMDAHGKSIQSWSRAGDRSWSNVHLLPNGDLLVIGQEHHQPFMKAISEHSYVLRLSWDGEELWRSDVNGHHDLEVNPQGQVAVLSFQRSTGTALTKAGVVLREDLVQLLDLGTGESREVRSLMKVLTSKPERLEIGRVQPGTTSGVRFVDLFHSNSVEFTRERPGLSGHALYEPGNVLVSSRHQNVIFLFDWESEELLWHWGTGRLRGPHDATVLDSGNVLIFDNGLGRGWSRVIELDPRTSEIVWKYKESPREDFYTASRGSSQRLPNGNTLIAESDRGRAFEVTAEGERVWTWINPERTEEGKVNTLMRMKRLPMDYVGEILNSRR